MSFFFNKDKRTPYEKARDESRAISSMVRREKLKLNREIGLNERETQRLTNEIRKHARANNQQAMRTLAKSIVKFRNNKSRLYSAIANLDTIDGAVKSQLTNVRIIGAMQKSSEVAQSLGELIKVEQFQAVSSEFSKELMKMGILDEMINDSVDGALETDDLEEETDQEVDKILKELLRDKVNNLPSVNLREEIPVDNKIEDTNEDDFLERLNALKSS